MYFVHTWMVITINKCLHALFNDTKYNFNYIFIKTNYQLAK